jgi:hypothetical protein
MLIETKLYKTDREIEAEQRAIAFGMFYDECLPINPAHLRRYAVRPSFLRGLVTRTEFEAVRRAFEEWRREVDSDLTLYEGTLNELEKRILAIETNLKKRSSLAAQSERNVVALREMFGLPKLTEIPKENVLEEMRGMLKEYSEEGVDSVELLRSVRGEDSSP